MALIFNIFYQVEVEQWDYLLAFQWYFYLPHYWGAAVVRAL